MKKQIWLLILFSCILSCGIQEEVEEASAECTTLMSSAMEKINSLQDDTCLTKEEIIDILKIVLQSSNSTNDCDTISHDQEHLAN